MNDLLRALPQVDRLARDPGLAELAPPLRVAAARQIVDELRASILAGGTPELPGDLVLRVRERARWLGSGRIVPVINATGVVIHTNLGRAPWSRAAVAAAVAVAGYCDLELSRDSGARGGRLSGVSAQLRHLTGAEAAVVVNNNAAAVLLALTALAAGREVVASRGELVEIGGSFRIPDVIASCGARLREVGTTNRTRTRDYAAAISPETGALLKVHPSNYRITGFTECPPRAELVALGRARGVPVIEDLGSGALGPLGAGDEPSVQEVVASGIDLVCFSGDKLLGGPQCGVIAGRAEVVARAAAHPLYRALRVDKVILAALEATLGDHVRGELPPVPRMLSEPGPAVQARAELLRVALASHGIPGEVVESPAAAGGGAWPGIDLPSWAVRVVVGPGAPSGGGGRAPDRVARALRVGAPPVLARVHAGALWFDARTLRPDEVGPVAAALASALRGE
ncbi:MAG: L-seryl-tRNA(Sec) selenium transferase [Myxococcota bacterium]